MGFDRTEGPQNNKNPVLVGIEKSFTRMGWTGPKRINAVGSKHRCLKQNCKKLFIMLTKVGDDAQSRTKAS